MDERKKLNELYYNFKNQTAIAEEFFKRLYDSFTCESNEKIPSNYNVTKFIELFDTSASTFFDAYYYSDSIDKHYNERNNSLASNNEEMKKLMAKNCFSKKHNMKNDKTVEIALILKNIFTLLKNRLPTIDDEILFKTYIQEFLHIREIVYLLQNFQFFNNTSANNEEALKFLKNFEKRLKNLNIPNEKPVMVKFLNK